MVRGTDLNAAGHLNLVRSLGRGRFTCERTEYEEREQNAGQAENKSQYETEIEECGVRAGVSFHKKLRLVVGRLRDNR